MSHEVVHAIGATVYFLFFLLFLWMSRVPRTNPGAEWWAAAMVCSLLALHWLPGYLIVAVAPQWYPQGFMLGMALVLVQYFSLLAAVLMRFQKRLLDAESKALDMAFEDPLTGLNNKRYMTTLFDKVLALATRSRQIVAKRLRASTRSADMCMRKLTSPITVKTPTTCWVQALV